MERHIQSVAYVPLWGQNFDSPAESVLSHVPYTKLYEREMRTTDAVVELYFLPLVTRLVDFCAQDNFTAEQLDTATLLVCGSLSRARVRVRLSRASQFADMYEYFQMMDWVKTWHHPATQERWVVQWSAHYTALDRSAKLTEAERPNYDDLLSALGFFIHFLLPLTMTINPRIPVVQSTHHGVQALVGAVAHRLYGAGFVIWDHGVMWREKIVALATFHGASLFVRNALVGLHRLAVFVNFHTADVVTPCTNVQNPQWEAWMGGGRGNAHRERVYHQRISPIVNGMETDKFKVVRSKEVADRPTAVMLSHVCDIKGACVRAGVCACARARARTHARTRARGGCDGAHPAPWVCAQTSRTRSARRA